MSKYREFWVDTENDESWPYDHIDGSETGMIHVIEKSAYDELLSEISDLADLSTKMVKDYLELDFSALKLVEALTVIAKNEYLFSDGSTQEAKSGTLAYIAKEALAEWRKEMEK